MTTTEQKTNDLPHDVVTAVYRNDLQFISNWITPQNLNSVDGIGRTILFHAVLANSIDCFFLLLKLHPNINIKDKQGWSPLHYAVQNYFVSIVSLLIDNGADIEIKDNYGNTPLWRAVYSSKGKGEVIKLLLGKGANINSENDSKISPIQLANTIANYNIKQYFPSS